MKNSRLITAKPRLSVTTAPNRLSVATTKSRRLGASKRTATRLRLWTERGQCCAACGRFVEHPYGYELDHMTALAMGGSNADENLQLLCVWFDHEGRKQGCHVEKTRSDGSHG